MSALPISGSHPSESEPLLGSGRSKPAKKPFYRPRPLWLIPFALLSALVRGMTLAPRVQVYTQLACAAVWDRYNHTTSYEPSLFVPNATYILYNPLYTSLDPAGPHLHPDNSLSSQSRIIFSPHHADTSTPPETTHLPPSKTPTRHTDPCLLDPAVQSAAAKIQTIMTTTMGILSAITTTWWGHFGERHGRTKVLAFGCLGMLITDVVFTLISTPGSPFSHPRAGQALLVLAPFIEGALGGWSSMQATTSAYIADCTSDGSRAHIFSRFIGIMFMGVALGPILGGLLIRYPIPFLTPALPHTAKAVTSVFVVAICFSFVNLLLLVFIVPESRTKNAEKVNAAVSDASQAQTEASMMGAASADAEEAEVGGTDVSGAEVIFSPSRSMSRGVLDASPNDNTLPAQGHLERIVSSFAIFLPRTSVSVSGKRRMDFSMTLLGSALLAYLLSTGIFQIKYLFAEHVFEWDAAELATYITLAAGFRMIHTLLIMPYLISTFKPKAIKVAPGAPKAAPTLEHLGKEMTFDIWLVRISFLIDILSHTAVALSPANNSPHAARIFTAVSILSGFGAGVVPALQSLALCIIQRDALKQGVTKAQQGGAGKVFGALASLQALGQQILGPILFGVLYSNTVKMYPKAIFVAAAGILSVAFFIVCALRPEAEMKAQAARKKKRALIRAEAEVERGRSRATKDLRTNVSSFSSPEGSDGFVTGSSASN